MTGVARTDMQGIIEKEKPQRLNRGMYTSVTDEWETPQEFFDAVNEAFHFSVDVCATGANSK